MLLLSNPSWQSLVREDRRVAFEKPALGAGFIKDSEKHHKCRPHPKHCRRPESRHRVSNPERSLSHEQTVLDLYSTSPQQRPQQQLAQDHHSTPRTQSQINDSANKDSLNELRKKLSQMCTEDYSRIIEMLYEDTDEQKLNLLSRAKSNPLLEESSDDKTPSPLVPGNRRCSRPRASPQISSRAPSPLSTDRIDNIQSISILSKNRQK
ncbi:hypothetical protein J6590_066492 [Homalodisca vitripennis]|nr:hypothetical protein J6590_066492 [Homalodisca vitripennis]